MVTTMKDRLYRSRINRYLGGVAAGLGAYFSIDPIIVRVLFIVLTFTSVGFGGILLYIVLWIIVPEEPYSRYKAQPAGAANGAEGETINADFQEEAEEPAKERSSYQRASQGQILAGLVLIGVGTIFLVDQIFPRINFDVLLPVALVGIGIAILLSSLKK